MPVIITGSGLPTAQGGNYRISKTDLMRSLNYLITSPDFKINAPADQHQASACAQIPDGESVVHGRIEHHSPLHPGTQLQAPLLALFDAHIYPTVNLPLLVMKS